MTYTNNIEEGGRLTPMVKELLMVTIGVFILQSLNHNVTALGALHADWLRGLELWRPVTYIFLHQNFMHILMNMYALFLFGPLLERHLGKYQFLTLYFLSGILGGLGWAMLAHGRGTCIGASGAVFGLLGSYAFLFPNDRLALIFPPVVLKAWQFVLGYGLWELIQVLGQSGGPVANAAHLFGGIAGSMYTLVLIRKYEPWRYQRATKWLDWLRTLLSQNRDQMARNEQVRVDKILEKIGREGIGSLTDAERKILKKTGRS